MPRRRCWSTGAILSHGAFAEVSRRVLVVGTGVVGLCSALLALRSGLAVTLVDREGAQRSNCSFGNSGIIVPSHFVPLAAPGAVRQGLAWMQDPASPFYIRPRPSLELLGWLVRFARSATAEHVSRAAPLLRDLALASRALHETFASEADFDVDLVKSGLLVVCRTEHAMQEERQTAAFSRQLGLRADVHDGSSLASLDPTLRDDLAGGVHHPMDCHLTPRRLMASLESAVVAAGGHFRWNTEIVRWRRDASPRRIAAAVTSAGEEIAADEFVLCAGAWSRAALRGLGLSLPMQAGKGYSLSATAGRWRPAHCAILSEARVAVTPMQDCVRIGGTMELDGLRRDIDARRVRAIIEAAGHYYAAFDPIDFEDVAPWSGLRPCSPDGLPYIGRTRRFPNLVIATGHAMMGVTLAPVTGRIVADLLTGAAPGFDMTQLSPDRFAGRAGS